MKKIEDMFIREQDFAEVMASKVLPFLKDKTKDGGDIPWITIFDIANYASIYYYAMNVDAQTVDNSQDMGLIEETITNIGVSILNQLTRLLGLKDVTTLIYETGEEGSLTGGVMASGWWSIMLKYHLIFQLHLLPVFFLHRFQLVALPYF